jgi:hypothetical protein
MYGVVITGMELRPCNVADFMDNGKNCLGPRNEIRGFRDCSLSSSRILCGPGEEIETTLFIMMAADVQ